MGVYFTPREAKGYSTRDGSLKLGTLRAGVFMVNMEASRAYRSVLIAIASINGLNVFEGTMDQSSIRLNKDIISNKKAVREVMSNIKELIDKKTIAKELIHAIEELTGFKHHHHKKKRTAETEVTTPSPR